MVLRKEHGSNFLAIFAGEQLVTMFDESLCAYAIKL